MSRSDEEGFHPHPGDPWHPGWDGEGDDDDVDVDPFAAETADDSDADTRPKKRGRFGRRKAKGEDAPATDDGFAATDDDLAEPSGWEAYDDEMVAADLESVVAEGAPSWTDEGGSSVEFESAFTVGGDLGSDETGPDDPGADDPGSDGVAQADPDDDQLDLAGLGLTEAVDAPELSEDDPTVLLDEIALPDLPDLPDLGALGEPVEELDGVEPPAEPTQDPVGDSTSLLDSLLGHEGGEPIADETELLDDLLAADDEDETTEPDDSVMEIPASAGVADLTRAAEDAAAALRSRAVEIREDEAIERVAGELGAVEIEELPDAGESPPEPPQGLQDTLVSAGLDLEDDEAPPTDPGYTPEFDEPEEADVSPSVEDDSSLPDEVATIVPGFTDEPDSEDILPDEIAPVDSVDAALSAIAAEPIASADPEALDALRSIDGDDDDDEWQAYAGGDTVEVPEPPDLGGAGEFLDDLEPPLVPMASDEAPLAASEEAPVSKPGFFGRRKERKAAEAGIAGESGWADAGEDWQSDDTNPQTASGDALDATADVAGDWDDGAFDSVEDADAGAPGTDGWADADDGFGGGSAEADTPAGDDEIAGDDEADAFFAGESESRRKLFGSRRRAVEPEPVLEDPGPSLEASGVVPDEDVSGVPAGSAAWGDQAADALEQPAVTSEEIPDPGAWGGSDPAASDLSVTEEVSDVGGTDAPDPVASDPPSFEEILDSGALSASPPSPTPEVIPAQADPPPPLPPAEDQAGLAESPIEQPLSDLPLLDEGVDRVEVAPVGEAASPTGSGAIEEGEEYSEWRGEGSRVPASWFADVDEDEVQVEDLLPVDADESGAVLEAGGMFDVGDILDPVDDPVGDPADEPGLAAVEPFGSFATATPTQSDAPGSERPRLEAVEPPDLFEPTASGEPPPSVPPDVVSGPPDLLGDAAALVPGEHAQPTEPTLWDETAEMDVAEVPEPPQLPGAGAEAWDAPPLVPGGQQEWEDDADPSVETHTPFPDPPIDPTAEVYDVVEDDLDRAPAPEPSAGDPDAPVDWTQDVYSGAVTMEHRGLADAVAAAATEDTELQALSAAMPGLETGVVGFEDVEDLGTDEIYIPPVRSDLGARILTGLILVSLLFGSLWADGRVLAGFIGVMVMIGLTEYFTTLHHKGYTPVVIFGYLGAVGALAGTWFWGPIAVPGAILATTVVVFFFYAFAPRRRDALVNGGLTVMGMAWVTGTVAFAMPIIASENYRVLVFALVAATVAMDVGAYGFGRAWGSAQMAPVLSPNKSIEGLAGGVVLAIGVAIAIGYLMDPFDIQSGAALGLVVAVTAPLGDLAESMFKRSLGVKDMGAILPGHGGIMDRVDAFLFVIPPVWVLYSFLGYLS